MSEPPRRDASAYVLAILERIRANPILRRGLVLGIAAAALDVLRIVALAAAPKATSLATLLFLAPLVAFGLAGYLASKQTSLQAPGVLAGLLAGAVAGLVTAIVDLVLILRGAATLIPGSGRISAGTMLLVLFEFILFSASLGALGGALGAFLARSGARRL